MNRLTQYQWQKMNQQRLHDDLRAVWALVTERPGISLRSIERELNTTHWRTRRLVELLLKSGTLTQGNKNECGTLRAPIPLITVPLEETKRLKGATQ